MAKKTKTTKKAETKAAAVTKAVSYPFETKGQIRDMLELGDHDDVAALWADMASRGSFMVSHRAAAERVTRDAEELGWTVDVAGRAGTLLLHYTKQLARIRRERRLAQEPGLRAVAELFLHDDLPPVVQKPARLPRRSAWTDTSGSGEEPKPARKPRAAKAKAEAVTVAPAEKPARKARAPRKPKAEAPAAEVAS